MILYNRMSYPCGASGDRARDAQTHQKRDKLDSPSSASSNVFKGRDGDRLVSWDKDYIRE